MKSRDLEKLGVPRGEIMRLAIRLCAQAAQDGLKKKNLRKEVKMVLEEPAFFLNHKYFAELAQAMAKPEEIKTFVEREEPAPWKQWGDDLEEEAIQQMENACRLPVAVSGALMPDAHVGYGLPIGGVLATENAVIPYAVGVDIACRMKMTVFDIPVQSLKGEKDRLINILEEETRFGIGATFRRPRDHQVMSQDWGLSPITRKLKNKAQSQLGTSGSGNHFVEFGTFTLSEDDLDLKAGTYLALLSHSGSRGPGASVANHFSKLAQSLRPELPKSLKHLAWLDLDTEEGQEYWYAMQLMGDYAAANHDVIHREIVKALKADALLQIDNHHNFAWKQRVGDREVIVHRKGATPAGKGVLGIIPGSMATPGYVVRGRGETSSLESASHGAGRVMSRKVAKRSFAWSNVRKELDEAGVTLLSAGLDEVPGVYKDINTVMSHQSDLVDIIGRFDPKIVKMAPAGERPED